MSVQIFKPNIIKFTDKAANKVKSLIENEDEKLNLRVFVSGGGCSGFQYGFSFDNEIEEDDTIIDNLDVKLVVDSMSLQYLVGAIIDYSESLEGSRFIVNNPNAKTTCGCGSSFTI